MLGNRASQAGSQATFRLPAATSRHPAAWEALRSDCTEIHSGSGEAQAPSCYRQPDIAPQSPGGQHPGKQGPAQRPQPEKPQPEKKVAALPP
ncbi:hypothetical protein NDU88_001117 [Pleurodeles waltl]|uniref:Uncharacterized protein n=1 Tax=Pleurodeles waltl TaxID=8319 RepID=A0AAV7W0I9_PLEWA|nr:hypothetical protein NDU88_001117 [Pleurodeles waltl]